MGNKILELNLAITHRKSEKQVTQESRECNSSHRVATWRGYFVWNSGGYISCKLHRLQLGFVPLVVSGRNDLHMASNLRSG